MRTWCAYSGCPAYSGARRRVLGGGCDLWTFGEDREPRSGPSSFDGRSGRSRFSLVRRSFNAACRCSHNSSARWHAARHPSDWDAWVLVRSYSSRHFWHWIWYMSRGSVTSLPHGRTIHAPHLRRDLWSGQFDDIGECVGLSVRTGARCAEYPWFAAPAEEIAIAVHLGLLNDQNWIGVRSPRK